MVTRCSNLRTRGKPYPNRLGKGPAHLRLGAGAAAGNSAESKGMADFPSRVDLLADPPQHLSTNPNAVGISFPQAPPHPAPPFCPATPCLCPVRPPPVGASKGRGLSWHRREGSKHPSPFSLTGALVVAGFHSTCQEWLFSGHQHSTWSSRGPDTSSLVLRGKQSLKNSTQLWWPGGKQNEHL